ncbi:hypothetical protein BHM03_00029029 [Ensete ventricosum]|nr:hypothetical protein BHM03_00029029 [Ensete ventricosum]
MRLAGAIGPVESQNRYGLEWLGGEPRAVRAPFGCRMIRFVQWEDPCRVSRSQKAKKGVGNPRRPVAIGRLRRRSPSSTPQSRPRGMATKKEIAGLRRSSEPSFTFVLRVLRDSRGAHRSDPTVGFDVVGTPNGRDRASQRTRVPCHCPAKKGGRGTSGRPTRRWRWRWRVAGGGGRQHFSVFGNPPITAIVGLVRRDHAIRARHE